MGPTITVPDALRDLRAWLLWKLVPDPRRPGKFRKVPYYVGSGKCRRAHGTPEDKAQLVDFPTALAAYQQGGFDGIGIAPLVEFGVTVVDFDDCVNGHVAPFVESLSMETYTEFSPSGKGAHAFVMGILPMVKDYSTPGNFGVEVFHGSGFVTFTGNPLPGCKMCDVDNLVADIPPALAALVEERRQSKAEPEHTPYSDDAVFMREMVLRGANAESIADLHSALMDGLSVAHADGYETWIKVGEALASLKGTPHEAEALELWHMFSARSAKYDEDLTQTKWDTFRPDRITFKTIFEMAQANGWVNPRSAQALKSGSPEDYAKLEDRTDVGGANLLVRLTEGNLRFVNERQMWIWWDESKWTADTFGDIAFSKAMRVAQFYHAEADRLAAEAKSESLSDLERKRLLAISEGLSKWAARCRSKHSVDAILAVMSKDGRVAVPSADLDKDPWLLGAANGVVDLRTGLLRPAGRDEFVTKRSPVAFDPVAKASRWCRFIEEITGAPLPVEFDAEGQVIPESVGKFLPRPALADYLQRVLGHTITGSVAEQKMFFFVGAGCNGKSAALDTVKETLGGYCRTIPPEALMATRHDADAERPSSVAASLAGCRLAISSESRDGQRLDVALIKRHTGGGTMNARLMRENSFEFLITHKLVLQTNSKPSLDHLDDAIRGRLHLIPFDRIWNRPGHPERDGTQPDGDKGLIETLRAEAPGILAWLVEGAVKYARQGLEPPAEVVKMTKSYLAEQDPISRWLEGFDRCDPKRGIPAADLFRQFQAWNRDEDDGRGQAPENVNAFGRALAGRQVLNHKAERCRLYGITSKLPFSP